MLKYLCLILDHDDTVVQSETSVNYPCFCRYLERYRPGTTYSLSEYMEDCSKMSFVEMCKLRFSLNDEEIHEEYLFWQEYARKHIPTAFPGIHSILDAYRQAGGIICVVSMSSKEQIQRDYRYHFGFEPDHIFDCDLPPEQRKPNCWALEQISKKYGFRSDQLLVVDDMKFAVKMARTAGSPIAFAGWGKKDFPALYKEMEALCDFSFYSTTDFSKFLFE